MAVDTRVSELAASLERMGAPVEAAMSEAVLRSMGGSPFTAALRSVAEDYAAGVWPESLTSEVVGESWERCARCKDDFLPLYPGESTCGECL